MMGIAGLKKYLCYAEYEVNSKETVYLLRDAYSYKTGQELRQAVINKFIEDITPKQRKGTDGKALSQYIFGRLRTMSIDELKMEAEPDPEDLRKYQI